MSKISELKAKYKKIKSTVDGYKSIVNDVTSLSGNKVSSIKDIPKVLKETPKAIWDQTVGQLGSNPKEVVGNLTTTVKNISGAILNIPKTAFNVVKNIGSTLKNVGGMVKGIGSTIKSIGSSLFGKKKRKEGETSDQTVTSESTQTKFLESAASEVPDTFALRGEEAFADRINPNNQKVNSEGVAMEKIAVDAEGSLLSLPIGTQPIISANIVDTASKVRSNSSSTYTDYASYYDKKQSCYYPGKNSLGHDEKNRFPAKIIVHNGVKLFIENFFLEGIQYHRNERISTVPLLNGDNIIYFYGKNPTTVGISGICLDMLNQQWLYDLEWYYEHILRGTVSTYGGITVEIQYDNKAITGYITSFNSEKQAGSMNTANFQMNLILVSERYLSDYATPDIRGAAARDDSNSNSTQTLQGQAITSILSRIKDKIGSRAIDFNAENYYYDLAKTDLIEKAKKNSKGEQ